MQQRRPGPMFNRRGSESRSNVELRVILRNADMPVVSGTGGKGDSLFVADQGMRVHALLALMARVAACSFGNDFETEALPGALPQGQNSPQKCNYGLYAEQLSGTAFTAPRGQNERTWCYRIRPSVHHTGRFSPIEVPHWKTAPNVVANVTSLGQYWWDPIPVPEGDLTWITGMRTMTTGGDVNIQVGMASHVYLVTRSMEDEYVFSADSELLVVPQEGRLRFATELGIIDLEPKEIAGAGRAAAERHRLRTGAGRPCRRRKAQPRASATGSAALDPAREIDSLVHPVIGDHRTS